MDSTKNLTTGEIAGSGSDNEEEKKGDGGGNQGPTDSQRTSQRQDLMSDHSQSDGSNPDQIDFGDTTDRRDAHTSLTAQTMEQIRERERQSGEQMSREERAIMTEPIATDGNPGVNNEDLVRSIDGSLSFMSLTMEELARTMIRFSQGGSPTCTPPKIFRVMSTIKLQNSRRYTGNNANGEMSQRRVADVENSTNETVRIFLGEFEFIFSGGFHSRAAISMVQQLGSQPVPDNLDIARLVDPMLRANRVAVAQAYSTGILIAASTKKRGGLPPILPHLTSENFVIKKHGLCGICGKKMYKNSLVEHVQREHGLRRGEGVAQNEWTVYCKEKRRNIRVIPALDEVSASDMLFPADELMITSSSVDAVRNASLGINGPRPKHELSVYRQQAAFVQQNGWRFFVARLKRLLAQGRNERALYLLMTIHTLALNYGVDTEVNPSRLTMILSNVEPGDRGGACNQHCSMYKRFLRVLHKRSLMSQVLIGLQNTRWRYFPHRDHPRNSQETSIRDDDNTRYEILVLQQRRAVEIQRQEDAQEEQETQQRQSVEQKSALDVLDERMANAEQVIETACDQGSPSPNTEGVSVGREGQIPGGTNDLKRGAQQDEVMTYDESDVVQQCQIAAQGLKSKDGPVIGTSQSVSQLQSPIMDKVLPDPSGMQVDEIDGIDAKSKSNSQKSLQEDVHRVSQTLEHLQITDQGNERASGHVTGTFKFPAADETESLKDTTLLSNELEKAKSAISTLPAAPAQQVPVDSEGQSKALQGMDQKNSAVTVPTQSQRTQTETGDNGQAARAQTSLGHGQSARALTTDKSPATQNQRVEYHRQCKKKPTPTPRSTVRSPTMIQLERDFVELSQRGYFKEQNKFKALSQSVILEKPEKAASPALPAPEQPVRHDESAQWQQTTKGRRHNVNQKRQRRAHQSESSGSKPPSKKRKQDSPLPQQVGRPVPQKGDAQDPHILSSKEQQSPPKRQESPPKRQESPPKTQVDPNCPEGVCNSRDQGHCCQYKDPSKSPIEWPKKIVKDKCKSCLMSKLVCQCEDKSSGSISSKGSDNHSYFNPGSQSRKVNSLPKSPVRHAQPVPSGDKKPTQEVQINSGYNAKKLNIQGQRGARYQVLQDGINLAIINLALSPAPRPNTGVKQPVTHFAVLPGQHHPRGPAFPMIPEIEPITNKLGNECWKSTAFILLKVCFIITGKSLELGYDNRGGERTDDAAIEFERLLNVTNFENYFRLSYDTTRTCSFCGDKVTEATPTDIPYLDDVMLMDLDHTEPDDVKRWCSSKKCGQPRNKTYLLSMKRSGPLMICTAQDSNFRSFSSIKSIIRNGCKYDLVAYIIHTQTEASKAKNKPGKQRLPNNHYVLVVNHGRRDAASNATWVMYNDHRKQHFYDSASQTPTLNAMLREAVICVFALDYSYKEADADSSESSDADNSEDGELDLNKQSEDDQDKSDKDGSGSKSNPQAPANQADGSNGAAKKAGGGNQKNGGDLQGGAEQKDASADQMQDQDSSFGINEKAVFKPSSSLKDHLSENSWVRTPNYPESSNFGQVKVDAQMEISADITVQQDVTDSRQPHSGGLTPGRHAFDEKIPKQILDDMPQQFVSDKNQDHLSENSRDLTQNQSESSTIGQAKVDAPMVNSADITVQQDVTDSRQPHSGGLTRIERLTPSDEDDIWCELNMNPDTVKTSPQNLEVLPGYSQVAVVQETASHLPGGSCPADRQNPWKSTCCLLSQMYSCVIWDPRRHKVVEHNRETCKGCTFMNFIDCKSLINSAMKQAPLIPEFDEPKYLRAQLGTSAMANKLRARTARARTRVNQLRAFESSPFQKFQGPRMQRPQIQSKDMQAYDAQRQQHCSRLRNWNCGEQTKAQGLDDAANQAAIAEVMRKDLMEQSPYPIGNTETIFIDPSRQINKEHWELVESNGRANFRANQGRLRIQPIQAPVSGLIPMEVVGDYIPPPDVLRAEMDGLQDDILQMNQQVNASHLQSRDYPLERGPGGQQHRLNDVSMDATHLLGGQSTITGAREGGQNSSAVTYGANLGPYTQIRQLGNEASPRMLHSGNGTASHPHLIRSRGSSQGIPWIQTPPSYGGDSTAQHSGQCSSSGPGHSSQCKILLAEHPGENIIKYGQTLRTVSQYIFQQNPAVYKQVDLEDQPDLQRGAEQSEVNQGTSKDLNVDQIAEERLSKPEASQTLGEFPSPALLVPEEDSQRGSVIVTNSPCSGVDTSSPSYKFVEDMCRRGAGDLLARQKGESQKDQQTRLWGLYTDYLWKQIGKSNPSNFYERCQAYPFHEKGSISIIGKRSSISDLEDIARITAGRQSSITDIVSTSAYGISKADKDQGGAHHLQDGHLADDKDEANVDGRGSQSKASSPPSNMESLPSPYESALLEEKVTLGYTQVASEKKISADRLDLGGEESWNSVEQGTKDSHSSKRQLKEEEKRLAKAAEADSWVSQPHMHASNRSDVAKGDLQAPEWLKSCPVLSKIWSEPCRKGAKGGCVCFKYCSKPQSDAAYVKQLKVILKDHDATDKWSPGLFLRIYILSFTGTNKAHYNGLKSSLFIGEVLNKMDKPSFEQIVEAIEMAQVCFQQVNSSPASAMLRTSQEVDAVLPTDLEQTQALVDRKDRIQLQAKHALYWLELKRSFQPDNSVSVSHYRRRCNKDAFQGSIICKALHLIESKRLKDFVRHNKVNRNCQRIFEGASGCGRNRKVLLDQKQGVMTVGQTQYIALDILEKNKDYAVEFYGFKPRNFIVRDLHGFDFTYDDGARIKFVDLVLLWNTFCYFNSLQISEILDEIKKALSPNGQLIICEPWETKERFAIRGFDHCTFRPPSYYNTVWRDHGLVVLHFKDYPSRDFKDSKGKVFETGSSRVWLIQP